MQVKYTSISGGTATQHGEDHNTVSAAQTLGQRGSSISGYPSIRNCPLGAWRDFFASCGFTNCNFYDGGGQTLSSHTLMQDDNNHYVLLMDDGYCELTVPKTGLLGVKTVTHSSYSSYFCDNVDGNTIKLDNGDDTRIYALDEVNLCYDNASLYMYRNDFYFPGLIKAPQLYTNNNGTTVNTKNDQSINGSISVYLTDMPNYAIESKSMRGLYCALAPKPTPAFFDQVRKINSISSTTATIYNPTSKRYLENIKALGYTEIPILIYNNVDFPINNKTCRSYVFFGDREVRVFYSGSTFTFDSYKIPERATLVRYVRTPVFKSLKLQPWNSYDPESLDNAVDIFVQTNTTGGQRLELGNNATVEFQVNIDFSYTTQIYNGDTSSGETTDNPLYTSIGSNATTKSSNATAPSINSDGSEGGPGGGYMTIGQSVTYQSKQPTTYKMVLSGINYKEVRTIATNIPTSFNLSASHHLAEYNKTYVIDHPDFPSGDYRYRNYSETVGYNKDGTPSYCHLTSSSVFAKGLLPKTKYNLLDDNIFESYCYVYGTDVNRDFRANNPTPAECYHHETNKYGTADQYYYNLGETGGASMEKVFSSIYSSNVIRFESSYEGGVAHTEGFEFPGSEFYFNIPNTNTGNYEVLAIGSNIYTLQ